MYDPTSSRPRRRTLLLIGAGSGVLLAAAGTIALVSGLAIADQPGEPLDTPALVVEVETTPGATTPSTPVPTTTSTAEPGSTELVPAPTPVAVDDDDGDDHGGDRPRDDNSGSSSSDD